MTLLMFGQKSEWYSVSSYGTNIILVDDTYLNLEIRGSLQLQ